MSITSNIKWIVCLAFINPINLYALFSIFHGDIMLWGGDENYQFHWSLMSIFRVFFPPTSIFVLALLIINVFDKSRYSIGRASIHYVVSIVVASLLMVIIARGMLLL